MPSLKTRLAYDRIVLATAQEAITDAAAALSETTTLLETVQDDVTGTVADLADLVVRVELIEAELA